MPIDFKLILVENLEGGTNLFQLYKKMSLHASGVKKDSTQRIVVSRGSSSSSNNFGNNEKLDEYIGGILEKMNLLRFIDSKVVTEFASNFKIFAGMDQKMINFCLNSTELFSKKIKSIKRENMTEIKKQLDIIQDKLTMNLSRVPILELQLTLVENIVVVKRSKFEKLEIKNIIAKNIDFLVKVDHGMVRKNTKNSLLKIVDQVIEISSLKKSNNTAFDTKDTENLKILEEKHSKLGWLLRHLRI